MRTIQKFRSGLLYSAPSSNKIYELLERNGHFLTFRARNPKTKDSFKLQAASTYKADASGAFEEVLFSDGVRLRTDSFCPEPKKAHPGSSVTKVEIIGLNSTNAA